MRGLLLRVLWHACDVGLGRSYGHTGDDTQDCIRFQVAVIDLLYPGALDGHHDVLHLNGQPIGSLANMETLIQLGVADEAATADDRGVYALQGWNGGRGHAIFLIRRPDDGSLWVMDFTTATTDGLRPAEWREIVRKWPTRLLVKLRA